MCFSGTTYPSSSCFSSSRVEWITTGFNANYAEAEAVVCKKDVVRCHTSNEWQISLYSQSFLLDDWLARSHFLSEKRARIEKAKTVFPFHSSEKLLARIWVWANGWAVGALDWLCRGRWENWKMGKAELQNHERKGEEIRGKPRGKCII